MNKMTVFAVSMLAAGVFIAGCSNDGGDDFVMDAVGTGGSSGNSSTNCGAGGSGGAAGTTGAGGTAGSGGAGGSAGAGGAGGSAGAGGAGGSAGAGGAGGSSGGPTGTPLDLLLGPLMGAFGSFAPSQFQSAEQVDVKVDSCTTGSGGGGAGGSATGGAGGSAGSGGAGGTTTVGQGKASECFKDMAPGSTVEFAINMDGGGTLRQKDVHEGTTTFEGKPASKVSLTQTVRGTPQNGAADSNTTGSAYGLVEGSVPRYTGYGADTESEFINPPLAGSKIAISIRFDPGLLRRFDLNPGDSYLQNYTAKATPGGEFKRTRDTKFLGQETITIPAGTFVTCKFEYTETEEGKAPGKPVTEWYGKNMGIGLAIKSIGADGKTTEFSEIKINGVPVTTTPP